jgi:hypothetical protein
MLVHLDEVVTGVLVDAIAAMGRLLIAPPKFGGRRGQQGLTIARWFDTYELIGEGPALPDMSPLLAERVSQVLRGDEVQAALLELLAARLTDAPEVDVNRVRAIWEKTLAAVESDGAYVAVTLFDYYDSKICEMVGRLEGRDLPLLKQIRTDAMNVRVIAVLNSIERHVEALSSQLDKRSEEDFLNRYRRQIIEQHGMIEPPDLKRRQRVPIANIYVSPLIYHEFLSERESTARKLDIERLAKEVDRTVLLGDPGAGKTTAANVLAHSYASDTNRPVPFLVTLRDFAAPDSLGRSIAEHIEYKLNTFYQCPAPIGYIDRLLLSRRALVIFDGLDELLDTSRRSDISTRIERFCTEYPLARVLVTSRLVGYEESRLDNRQFTRYRLGAFSDEQVTEYVRKWFVQEIDMRDAHGWADSFLKESESASDLRQVPLMLSLLCILYRGEGSLPRKRSELYEQCAKLLFDKWDSRRGIHQDLRVGHLIEPALQHLAWWLFTDDDARLAVTESELVSQTTAFLHGRGFESESDAKAAAAEFVEFCRGRMWVFTDVGTSPAGEDLYAFTHRTFMEYFAAARIAYDSDAPEQLGITLAPHIERRTWDVVGELAIQIKDRTSRDGARRIYDTLLRTDYRSTEGRDNILDFLAMCLRSVDPSPQIVRRLTQLTFDNLIETDNSSHKNRPRPVERGWPQSLSRLLTSSPPFRETIADEIDELISSKIQSNSMASRLAALRLAVWLLQALPGAYNHESVTEWQFWNTRRNDNIHSYASVITTAAETDGGMRQVALAEGFITVAQALEMPDGLLTLFHSHSAAPCPITWPPYFGKLANALMEGWPAFDASIIGSDLSSIGQYLLVHSSPPWVKGKLSRWDDTIEDESTFGRDVGHIELTPTVYIGAGVILAILTESNMMKLIEQKLGPFRDFYPYLATRRDSPSVRYSLPELPLPDAFKNTFRDWADRKIDFT